MLKFSRFVKKKSESGDIFISCKLRKGKLTTKQSRALCGVLNEALENCIAPKET